MRRWSVCSQRRRHLPPARSESSGSGAAGARRQRSHERPPAYQEAAGGPVVVHERQVLGGPRQQRARDRRSIKTLGTRSLYSPASAISRRSHMVVARGTTAPRTRDRESAAADQAVHQQLLAAQLLLALLELGGRDRARDTAHLALALRPAIDHNDLVAALAPPSSATNFRVGALCLIDRTAWIG